MHKITTSPSFSLAACFTASILAYNTWETATVIFLSPRLRLDPGFQETPWR